jgi:aquaporin Z
LTPARRNSKIATADAPPPHPQHDRRTTQDELVANWRKYAAELLGTFVLVFGGTTAIVASGRPGFAAPVLVVVPFAFGLALLAGLYAFGEVSGGHFNPAVSLAFFLDRRLEALDLIAYWVAQFLGGIFAAILLLIATNQDDVASAATKPASDGTAFVIEVAFTTIFVLVILQASRSESFGSSGSRSR